MPQANLSDVLAQRAARRILERPREMPAADPTLIRQRGEIWPRSSRVLNSILYQPHMTHRQPASRNRRGRAPASEMTAQLHEQCIDGRVDEHITCKTGCQHFFGEPRKARADVEVLEVEAGRQRQPRSLDVQVALQLLLQEQTGEHAML